MVRRPLVLVAVLFLSVGTAFAQEVDVRPVLEASLKAMGGENLKTVWHGDAMVGILRESDIVSAVVRGDL